MKNLSRHIAVCELVTSLLIKGIQMGGMSRLGWLIGLVKHAIWADSLYFVYLLIQFPKSMQQNQYNAAQCNAPKFCNV
jgi:hypothetical protein